VRQFDCRRRRLRDVGRYSLAVIFIAFVVVGLLTLAVAEVASRYDVTGGPQYYAQVAFGPLTGFTVGWLFHALQWPPPT
jgi:amino acid transporter